MTHPHESTKVESFVIIIHGWNLDHTQRVVRTHPVWESESPERDINLAIVRFCNEFGSGGFTVCIEAINA